MANYNDIKYPNAVSSNATGLSGGWNLLKTQTVTAGSSVSAVDFIHGTSSVVFDSTYEAYLIMYTMVHPSVQKPEFQWAPGDGDFTDDKHSANFIMRSNNTESDVDGGGDPSNGNDQSCSGQIYITDAGETDTWKVFLADGIGDSMGYNDEMESSHAGGMIRQTGAIDRFRFNFSSGNIDVGLFSLYGFSKS